jgi:hypothetical protein
LYWCAIVFDRTPVVRAHSLYILNRGQACPHDSRNNPDQNRIGLAVFEQIHSKVKTTSNACAKPGLFVPRRNLRAACSNGSLFRGGESDPHLHAPSLPDNRQPD